MRTYFLNSAIILTLFFLCVSCQNDDDGVLFPDGSRKLTIEFNELLDDTRQFCFVSDPEGRIWWDTTYMRNISFKELDVPLNDQMNITFGRSSNTNDRVFLETFVNAEANFKANISFIRDCPTRPRTTNFIGTFFKINNVNTPLEIVQTGLTGLANEFFDQTTGEFSFNANPYMNLDQGGLYTSLIVVRELLTGVFKCFIIPDALMNVGGETQLNYLDFSAVRLEFVEFEEASRWDFDMTVRQDEERIVIKSKSYVFGGGQPFSSQLAIYLPKDLTFDDLTVGFHDGYSFGASEIVIVDDVLPATIDVLQFEIIDQGSDAKQLDYTVDMDADFVISKISFDNYSTWEVYEVKPGHVDFEMPVIPRSALDYVSTLSSELKNGISLEVTPYVFDQKSDIPMLELKNIRNNLECVAHVNRKKRIDIPQ